MKKVLIVASLSTFLSSFEKSNIRILQELKFEVHCAANFENDGGELDDMGIIKHQICFQRSPYKMENMKAYRELKRLIKENKFFLIHCHTPIGGVITRLATRNNKSIKVIYTAHGFHFYEGAPIIKWAIYYPIEKYLSMYTDALITINTDDYLLAKKRFLSKNIHYVPGVGIDIKRFAGIDKKTNNNSKIVLLSVGELSKRKNHRVVIEAIKELKDKNLVYYICGKGELENSLKNLVEKYNLSLQIQFLGFRNDINRICSTSDIFIFPSIQEGLPVALMEAMSVGLPVIASKIRGTNDLVDDGKGGFLIEGNKINEYIEKIQILLNSPELRKQFGEYNRKKIKQFEITKIRKIMSNIYIETLGDYKNEPL